MKVREYILNDGSIMYVNELGLKHREDGPAVETKEYVFNVNTGQAIITYAGEWIRYSTPNPVGAEYVAVCLPAFSPETVHRD